MASKYFSALRVAEYELSLAEDRARTHGGPDAFSECMAKRAAVDHVKTQMEELVRERLVRGDVIAIGLKDGAGAGAENEVIPADFWAYADIDFEGMTARYRDQRYTSIHAAVYHPARHDAPPPTDHGKPPASKIGAPSWEEPREQAIKIAAERDGRRFFGRSYKEQIPLVKAVLDELRPEWRNERGFSDKSFEADIRKLKSAK